MPRLSEHPKLRVHRKTGTDGQVWVSYSYDMRGTGWPDVALGTDREAALRRWQELRDAPRPPPPKKKPRRTARIQNTEKAPARPVEGKRRNFGHPLWDDAPSWAKPMYIAADRRSVEAGRPAFLSAAEFLAVVKRAGGRCELTGIAFDATRHAPGKRAPFAASLDRIDCAGGYVADNVRLVCLIVNCALGDFGEQAFQVAAEAFLKARCGTGTPACGEDLAGAVSDASVSG